MKMSELIHNTPIIPVITVSKLEDAKPLAGALIAAGLNVLEITMRTPCALDAISAIKKQYPECLIGAGTLIHPEQFAAVKAAGATFTVSPAITLSLVEAAQDANIPYLPGVATPSEIVAAMELGFTELKFFPANLYGGIKALKNFAALFPDIQFCPTGGINPDNLASYLALENVMCIGGSWLSPQKQIAAQDWPAITKLAQDALAIV